MTNHYTDVCEATIESLRQTVERQAAQIELMRKALTLALDDCIAQAVYWSSGDPDETSSTVRAVKAAIASVKEQK